MRALAAPDLLQVLEWGEGRHPIDQALSILAIATPEKGWETLADLSLGERDARLLEIRELTLGPELEGYAECPACQEGLEFNLRVADLLSSRLPPENPGEFTFHAEEVTVRFRLPTSRDLAAVLNAGDLDAARQRLLARCILETRIDGETSDWEHLDEAVIAAIGEKITTLDPLSEILLDLHCAACEHRWRVPFDVTTYFWREIRSQARRVIREVHLLARAYGWREADILAMSPSRRGQYLALVD